MKDIIIVGAGPAGLTAAIYGLRAGKSVLLLEELTYGGKIVNTPDIENYPGLNHVSGFDFATALYQQAMDLGAELKYERAESVEDLGDKKIVHTAKNNYEAKAVILATGAKDRHLGLDREDELTGKGVSYCAACDGAFFRGKDVAVVGGGNTALGDALFLADFCSHVYVIHRRDQFRGAQKEVKLLEKKENVSFVLNANVTKLLGDQKVEGVEVTDKVTGAKKEIPLAGVFIAIGQVPDNRAFENLVDLDQAGYIASGEDCTTRTPGIYTAGDCRTKIVRQLTTAAADGSVAALAAAENIG